MVFIRQRFGILCDRDGSRGVRNTSGIETCLVTNCQTFDEGLNLSRASAYSTSPLVQRGTGNVDLGGMRDTVHVEQRQPLGRNRQAQTKIAISLYQQRCPHRPNLPTLLIELTHLPNMMIYQ